MGKVGEGEGEDAGAEGDGFGGGVFVGAVGDAVAAGDEDHGDGGDGGDEASVVVGTGDHFFVGNGLGVADGFEGGEDVGVGGGGGVGVDVLLGDGDVAAGLDVGDVGVEAGHGGVAAGYVGVADVEHEGDAGGDGVDGAGVNGDGADGGYGVAPDWPEALALAAKVWRSTERMSSAAAVRASRRSGMRRAPAWPPTPVIS